MNIVSNISDYIPKSILTADGDVVMRIAGIPARVPNRTKICAYLTNIQSIPISASTQLALASEAFDDTGEWDTGAYRFTAQNAGFYLIGGMITFATVEDLKYYQVRIETNYGSSVLSEVHGSHAANISVSGMILMNLAVNDIAQLNAYHNSAAAKNAVQGSNTTYMFIVRLF